MSASPAYTSILLLAAVFLSSCTTTNDQASPPRNHLWSEYVRTADEIFDDPNQNDEAAYAVLERGANEGDLFATYVLGCRLHQDGSIPPEKGIYWLGYASAQGYLPARLHLAKIYLNENDEPFNPFEGRRLLDELTRQHSYIPAMVTLGRAYLYGTMTYEKDIERARFWLTTVKDQSYEAANLLGLTYFRDTSDRSNRHKAKELFRQAIEMYRDSHGGKEYSHALDNLALLYRDAGQYHQAFKLAQRAAADNDPCAVSILGTFYEKDQGVPRNLTIARAYYERAAAAGCKHAEENLKALETAGE